MGVILDTLERKRRAAAAFIDLGFALILIDDDRKPFANCVRCRNKEGNTQYVPHRGVADCPHPIGTCHGYQAGSKDLSHVLTLLERRPYANLGIVNGMSGLVTVDIDTNHKGKPKPEAYQNVPGINGGWDVFATILERYRALEWPDTCLEVRTRNGGGHLTWRVPADLRIKNSSDGSFGWLIDIRGSDGYVPAPGTPVKDGCYERMSDVTNPGPAPEWLLHHLKVTGHFPEPPRPFVPRQARADRDRSWGYAQLDKFADELSTAAEGTGHDALCRLTTAAAYLVAEGLVSEIDARDALYEAGANRPRSGVSQRAYESEFTTAWRTALAKAGGMR